MENQRCHGSALFRTQFVERLISRLTQRLLPSQSATDPASPLSTVLPSDTKPLMLTLHCLFPNELLLALDILDRGLVTRLARGDANREDSSSTADPFGELFFVISTSAAPSTSAKTLAATRAGQMGYEVRLQAWNCTCPAFVLAVFRDLSTTPTHEMRSSSGDAESPREGDQGRTCYPYGGWLAGEPTRTSSPPVCKHLLACLLMARCPGAFRTAAEEAGPLIAPLEELAGWSAGWSE